MKRAFILAWVHAQLAHFEFSVANNDLYVVHFNALVAFGSRKLSIVYGIFLVSSRKCMQCIERTAWNENENVNKTKSDSLFMCLPCHINSFYQFIARDPPKIIDAMLCNVHITMRQWVIISILPLKIDEFMKSINHKAALITFIRKEWMIRIHFPFELNRWKYAMCAAAATGCMKVKLSA